MGAVQGRANDAEEDGRTSEKLQKQNFSIEDAQKVDSNSDKQVQKATVALLQYNVVFYYLYAYYTPFSVCTMYA